MSEAIGRRLPCRTELFAVVLAVAVLNAASHRIIGSLEDGLVPALLGLFKISAIIWFALYAIVRLGLEASDAQPASRWDLAVLALIALACLLPTRAPAVFAMLAGGAYLLATSMPRSTGRRIAVIVLALGGPLLLGPLALNLFGTELLPIDAWLGGLFSGNSAAGNLIQTPAGEMDLLVMPGCSAFGNLTLVVVLAVSLAALFDVPFGAWMKGAVALAAVGVVLVNASRLAAMALYPEHFDWLHSGGGATLFGYAALLVMAPIIGFAVLRSQVRAA